MPETDDDDPILRQRARALAIANAGQRTGYALLGIALLLFFGGLAFGLTNLITTLIVVCMALAALTLGPSIILGYAAKAAERYERTGKTGH